MKIIMNVEISDGYEKWKQLFESTDDAREKYGVKVLDMVILRIMRIKFIKY